MCVQDTTGNFNLIQNLLLLAFFTVEKVKNGKSMLKALVVCVCVCLHDTLHVFGL